MQYHIREWGNQSASLIAEDGHTLSHFATVEDALEACVEDCLVEPEFIESYGTYLESSPLDYDGDFLD